MRISCGISLYFNLALCCSLGNLGRFLDNLTKIHTETSDSISVVFAVA